MCWAGRSRATCSTPSSCTGWNPTARLPPATKNESRNSLPAVLERRGLGSIAPEEKKAMQEWIASGGPFTDEDRQKILDYNAGDVRVLPPLLRKYEAWLLQDRHLFTALIYGRFMVAAGRMENVGIPIDMALHERVEQHKGEILHGLIADVDARFGVFKKDVFNLRLFREWLQREGIDWRYLDSGMPSTSEETFKDFEHLHPDLPELRQLMKTKRQLAAKKEGPLFPIGSDGRARTMLSPFATKTSRNAPRQFIFRREVAAVRDCAAARAGADLRGLEVTGDVRRRPPERRQESAGSRCQRRRLSGFRQAGRPDSA